MTTSTAGDARPGASKAPPHDVARVIVKKYANRRLYNTESSSYITLDNLADMVREGRDFVVLDAKTSEDITRSVLTQIIVEEESKGRAMLPTNFLRQLIGFYGDSMQGVVPRYLEQAMATFARQQEQMRRAMQQTVQQAMTPFMPFGGSMEEVGRQNMAMIERAMSLFTPFFPDAAQQDQQADDAAPAVAAHAEERQVAALQAEIESLRGQLADLRANGAAPPK